jgi:hypothetical protein
MMMYDDDDEKKMLIYNIMENFEDISNIPPDYLEIVPDCDQEIIKNLPKTNIKISDGLSSIDTMKIDIKKLQLTKPKTNKSKNRMSIANLKFNDLYKVRENIYGDLNDEKGKQKFLLIREKFEMSLIDLKNIYSNYDVINSNLKFLYNNYQYLLTNPILNEKNKRMKIIEFITEFSKQFKNTICKFRDEKIEFSYLNDLKEELIKFCVNKFQIVVAYIINSRSFSNVDLETLIKLE